MALILVYSTVALVISLVLSVAFPGTIYWLAPFFIGTFFFGSAIIARRQKLGYAARARAVEVLTPGGLANELRGSRELGDLLFPPRYPLVMAQLERDGWGAFLRRLEAAPDPNTLTEPWRTE